MKKYRLNYQNKCYTVKAKDMRSAKSKLLQKFINDANINYKSLWNSIKYMKSFADIKTVLPSNIKLTVSGNNYILENTQNGQKRTQSVVSNENMLREDIIYGIYRISGGNSSLDTFLATLRDCKINDDAIFNRIKQIAKKYNYIASIKPHNDGYKLVPYDDSLLGRKGYSSLIKELEKLGYIITPLGSEIFVNGHNRYPEPENKWIQKIYTFKWRNTKTNKNYTTQIKATSLSGAITEFSNQLYSENVQPEDCYIASFTPNEGINKKYIKLSQLNNLVDVKDTQKGGIMYKVTYEQDGKSIANLVHANSEQEAKDKIMNKKPNVEIIGIVKLPDIEVEGYKKRGMPIIDSNITDKQWKQVYKTSAKKNVTEAYTKSLLKNVTTDKIMRIIPTNGKSMIIKMTNGDQYSTQIYGDGSIGSEIIINKLVDANTIKDGKKYNMYTIRELCIKNNWYTNGDTEDYDNLLTKANNGQLNLEQITDDIYNHSRNADWYNINKKLSTTFGEAPIIDSNIKDSLSESDISIVEDNIYYMKKAGIKITPENVIKYLNKEMSGFVGGNKQDIMNYVKNKYSSVKDSKKTKIGDSNMKHFIVNYNNKKYKVKAKDANAAKKIVKTKIKDSNTISYTEYRKLKGTFPSGKYLSVHEYKEPDKNTPAELGINWSALGTVPVSQAQAMQKELDSAIKFVDEFNKKKYFVEY